MSFRFRKAHVHTYLIDWWQSFCDRILKLALDLVQSDIAHGIQPGQQNQSPDSVLKCQWLKQLSVKIWLWLDSLQNMRYFFRDILSKEKSSKVKCLWEMILLLSYTITMDASIFIDGFSIKKIIYLFFVQPHNSPNYLAIIKILSTLEALESSEIKLTWQTLNRKSREVRPSVFLPDSLPCVKVFLVQAQE